MFFYWSAQKMTKRQTLRKFLHLELFRWDLQCNLTLSHFLGRNSQNNRPEYIMMKCVSVCLSRKSITSHFRAERWRREVSSPLGLAGRRPALALWCRWLWWWWWSLQWWRWSTWSDRWCRWSGGSLAQAWVKSRLLRCKHLLHGHWTIWLSS